MLPTQVIGTSPETTTYLPTILDELKMACLPAAYKLLERLELKVQEPFNTADHPSHVVSRLFNRYSTTVLASMKTLTVPITTALYVSPRPATLHLLNFFGSDVRQYICA